LPITWYRTRSLFEEKPVYLPVCLTHTLKCNDRANRIYSNRPNGLSSGMTPGEAILQGLLEVIERDCECIFVGNSLPMPTVALDSIGDRRISGILDKAARLGVDVTVKYIANDIGLPTFYTMLFDPHSKYRRICWGTGTHLSKDIALYRSFTEAIQDRACKEFTKKAFLRTMNRHIPPDCRWEARRYHDLETGKADHRIEYLQRHTRLLRYGDIKDMDYDSIHAATRKVLKLLKASGIRQVYVADLSRFRIPTVRVIVPELEFMPKILYDFKRRDPRSRRLFQVPPKMGYREGIDFDYRSGLRNNFLI
jgi:ribosomal protein S12 methylthiotransferase accessory factor